MGFVVVLILGACAADVSEGSISSKNHKRIVNGTEVGELGIFKIVVSLHVERVVTDIGLPLR